MPQDLNSEFEYSYFRPPKKSPYWTQQSQPKDDSSDKSGRFWAASAGLIGAAFIPIGDKRVGDYYQSGMRFLEETSPGKILRTFGISQLLSPLASNKNFLISPEVFTSGEGHPNRAAREYFGSILGKTTKELEDLKIFETGLEYKKSGQLFGHLYLPGTETQIGGKVLPISMGPAKGNAFVDWYARSMDVKLSFGQSVVGEAEQQMMVLGAKRNARLMGMPFPGHAMEPFERMAIGMNMMRAHAASQIGRMVKLLRSPGDYIPWVGELTEKAGLRGLKIPAGTASEMLGRILGLGMAVGGIATAASFLSDQRREQERSTSALILGTVGALAGLAYTKTEKGALVGAGIGAAIGVAPVFDEGIFQGLGTMWTKVSKGSAKTSENLGLTQSAREQELLAPGITQVSTMLGFTLSGALVGGLAGYSAKLASFAKLGVEPTNKYIEQLTTQITEKSQSIIDKGGWLNRAKGEIASGLGMGLKSEVLSIQGTKERLLTRGGRFGALAGLGTFAGLAMGAALFSGNVVPGIFAAEHTPEELEAIYSGQKEIEIKRGRWWEMGRSPYEGGKTSYMRPHWYPLLMADARTKGLYGSADEKWAQSSFVHPLESVFSDEFKYRWEEQHKDDRPYPISGPWGYDIPVVGPLVAATLGKIIKPPRIYRMSEWMKGNEALQVPQDTRLEPGLEGGTEAGVPTSPVDFRRGASETIARFNELRGLPGFVHHAIKEKLTGSQYYMEDYQEIASPQRALGNERDWYERELGGLGSLSEPIRRFIARERRRDYYNPLENNAASWLPGTGTEDEEYYIDFHRGDPFTKVPEGELRLPGAGYAALHPEVAGMSPEEYPLAHRYKILADVAPYSGEFKKARSQVSQAKKRKELTNSELDLVEKTNAQLDDKREKRKFSQYLYSDDTLETMKVRVQNHLANGLIQTDKGVFGLGDVNPAGERGTDDYRRKQAQMSDFLREHVGQGTELNVYVHRDLQSRFATKTTGEPYMPASIFAGGESLGRQMVDEGVAEYKKEDVLAARSQFQGAQRTFGNVWENITHIEPWIESLTPLSPMAKFVHQRTPVEDYAKSRVWGRDIAMWQKPWQHFIKPTMESFRTGQQAIPSDTMERWKIEQYFDRLKWIKFHALEQAAIASNDQRATTEFRLQQRYTMFGANPFGNPTNMLRALPGPDQNYFRAFASLEGSKERENLSSMIPEDQQRLYEGLWAARDEKAIKAQRLMGVEDPNAARIQERVGMLRVSEGQEINPELYSQYQKESSGGSYADWARQKEMRDYFQTNPLPGPNWIGWCVPAYKEINTLMGQKNIIDVVSGDKVESLKGFCEVKQIFSREVDEDICQVFVKGNNFQSLEATENHLVLAIKSTKCHYNLSQDSLCTNISHKWKCYFCESKFYKTYEPEWIAIKNLTINDLLVVPKLKSVESNPILDLTKECVLPKNTIVSNSEIRPKVGIIHPVKRFVEIDESIGWLVGYYLAEGNIWKTGERTRGVQFTSHIKEAKILELAAKIIKEKFGLTSHLRIRKKEIGSCAYLTIGSQIFALIIEQWAGRFCDHKHSPWWLTSITREVQDALLDGLLTGDASKDERNRLVLANENLCYMAKRIFESQDTLCSFRKLSIQENRKRKFLIEPLRKAQYGLIGNDFVAYRIEKIEKNHFHGIVCDLEVETEHMYSCVVGIYHNSPGVSLDDVKMKSVEKAGLDFHDFGMWENQQRSMLRKPYLSDDPLREELTNPHSAVVAGSINRTMTELFGGRGVSVRILPDRGDRAIEVNMRDNRKKVLQRYKQDDDFQEMM